MQQYWKLSHDKPKMVLVVQLKVGLVLKCSRDHDSVLSEGIACLTSALWHHCYSTPARSPACTEKERGGECREQFRAACTTDCMPMPHLETLFPSNSSHVVFSKLHHIFRSCLHAAPHTNSIKTLEPSSILWPFFVMPYEMQPLFTSLNVLLLEVVTWL